MDFSVKDLTKRQREIFEFISRYLSRHGYPPTVREIGKAVGLHSSSTVHAHLAKLETLGVLKRDPTKPRAMEVLLDKAKRPCARRAAAGRPGRRGRADRRRGEHRGVHGDPGRDRRRGRRLHPAGARRAMIDAGILEGDFVVVRPAVDARDGEIVVALIDEEATVKRFFREKDHIRLQPENKSMKPIRTREAAVSAASSASSGDLLSAVMADGDRPLSSPETPGVLVNARRACRQVWSRVGALGEGVRARGVDARGHPSSAPGRTARLGAAAECPVCRTSSRVGCGSVELCGAELS